MVVGFNVFAATQDDKKKDRNHFESERIAFYTNALDLTIEEAQLFWPIYNQYEKESRDSHGEAMNALMKIRDAGNNITEEQAISLINTYTEALKKETSLTESYLSKFLKILPVSKAVRVFVVEDDFRMHLMRQFRGSRGQ